MLGLDSYFAGCFDFHSDVDVRVLAASDLDYRQSWVESWQVSGEYGDVLLHLVPHLPKINANEKMQLLGS